jgi:hypothetical protein
LQSVGRTYMPGTVRCTDALPALMISPEQVIVQGRSGQIT